LSNEPRTSAKGKVKKFPDKDVREVKYYGFHAALAVWTNRKESIIRVYLTKDRLKKFSDLLKWCAANKKAYHVVEDDVLSKVAAGVHHEGICILADERKRWEFKDWYSEKAETLKECPLIYLDGVQNPHNIGSILRVCANFGVPYVLGEKGLLPSMSSSAYRVAEGGAEFVEMVVTENPIKALRALEALDFQIVATSHEGKTGLHAHKFKKKTVIMLGAEVEGLNPKLLKEFATATVSVPGTGVIESLNVALAGGIFLNEYWRQVKSPRA
jgi:RNA methyltransferase, TrmH family